MSDEKLIEAIAAAMQAADAISGHAFEKQYEAQARRFLAALRALREVERGG